MAKNRQQGDLQVNDKETLKWYKNTVKPQKRLISEVLPNYSAIDEEMLFPYLPQSRWFLKKEHINSIHGIRHIVRVVIYSMILAQLEKDLKVKYEDAALCALIHDLRRKTDKGDVGHGKRAADWLSKNVNLFEPLGVAHINDVLYAVKNHEVSTENLDLNSGLYRDSLLKILKNADAVDRFRLPKEKWWPKREYLHFDTAIKLFDFVKYYIYITELESLDRPEKAIDVILNNSRKLGILKE